MIEKVARAICISADPDMCVSGSGGTGQPDVCYQRAWELHIGQAKVAIAAHEKALEAQGLVIVPREPNEEMKGAGFKAGEHELWSEPGYHEGETLTYLNDEAPEIIWQAMITAALEGGHEET